MTLGKQALLLCIITVRSRIARQLLMKLIQSLILQNKFKGGSYYVS